VAALDNRLLQYNAKGHFMNALLCYMAMGDEVGREGGREGGRAGEQKTEGRESTHVTAERTA
jgi:hypothetical protein